ncbi:MAG: VCBS repeat-containing protein [Bacteroidota bacterium]
MKTTPIYSLLLLILISCASPKTEQSSPEPAQKALSFAQTKIADSLQFIWAHCPADINGDRIQDLVFVNNNGYGGTLEYLRGQKEPGVWQRVMIAAQSPLGGTFAQGDIECADVDFDGDLDIVAVHHPGEWKASSEPSTIYWLENPTWEAHMIGTAPNFIKDISLADFDQDQKMDLAALTFETNTLSIFKQEDADTWERVQYYEGYKNLHEGMDVGDIDGDGWTDIVADALLFYCPGKDLSQAWREENLDPKWNTQGGDWSRNGTKAFVRDINADGQGEIFISHSERAGYPLSYYQKDAQGQWIEHIIADSIPACHTLQVFDFDGDGDFDVLAGVNKSRAQGLDKTEFPVQVFLSEAAYGSWQPMLLEADGIYNGQAADLEQDGDMDIFRYQTHDATAVHLLRNQVIQ